MSERKNYRKYARFKDSRNHLRGMDREELEEWRKWADDWKRSGSRKVLRESVKKSRNDRLS